MSRPQTGTSAEPIETKPVVILYDDEGDEEGNDYVPPEFLYSSALRQQMSARRRHRSKVMQGHSILAEYDQLTCRDREQVAAAHLLGEGIDFVDPPDVVEPSQSMSSHAASRVDVDRFLDMVPPPDVRRERFLAVDSHSKRPLAFQTPAEALEAEKQRLRQRGVSRWTHKRVKEQNNELKHRELREMQQRWDEMHRINAAKTHAIIMSKQQAVNHVRELQTQLARQREQEEQARRERESEEVQRMRQQLRRASRRHTSTKLEAMETKGGGRKKVVTGSKGRRPAGSRTRHLREGSPAVSGGATIVGMSQLEGGDSDLATLASLMPTITDAGTVSQMASASLMASPRAPPVPPALPAFNVHTRARTASPSRRRGQGESSFRRFQDSAPRSASGGLRVHAGVSADMTQTA